MSIEEGAARARFATSLGTMLTMIGVAVGLGNVWRFPYMVGRFGGAAFVVVYLLLVALIGVPALLAEWTLGRNTRRGTVGAFERAGLPGGRALGWAFFFVVAAATAYYTNVVGWVGFYALSEVARLLGATLEAARVLPSESTPVLGSVLRQVLCTGIVVLSCAVVLRRGVAAGTERVSRWVMPLVFGILLVLVLRSVTLPGSKAGLLWYLGHFEWAALTPAVVLAALGQAVFSLSLGGTFMVVYGSYLGEEQPLVGSALITALGDAGAGLLAGLAIFPALFALGGEPGSGPGLVFVTLPQVFEAMPWGALFGLLFFLGLAGAAFLSDVAAFEVLVAGLTDNTRLTRTQAVWSVVLLVSILALPPMLSMRIFAPWDLVFGSGMQTLGLLLAVLTVGWCLDRGRALQSMVGTETGLAARLLWWWVRFLIPAAVVAVGVWWVWTEVLRRGGW
ncbi:MAG: sodium-dependent transporter [Gemmatimonadota bacterium]